MPAQGHATALLHAAGVSVRSRLGLQVPPSSTLLTDGSTQRTLSLFSRELV